VYVPRTISFAWSEAYQFGGQAPGRAEEVCEFCTTRYHTAFPQLAKIDVNGDKAAPLFVL
jgi:glutathione peroxidase